MISVEINGSPTCILQNAFFCLPFLFVFLLLCFSLSWLCFVSPILLKRIIEWQCIFVKHGRILGSDSMAPLRLWLKEIYWTKFGSQTLILIVKRGQISTRSLRKIMCWYFGPMEQYSLVLGKTKLHGTLMEFFFIVVKIVITIPSGNSSIS